jgi:hypothetical protein
LAQKWQTRLDVEMWQKIRVCSLWLKFTFWRSNKDALTSVLQNAHGNSQVVVPLFVYIGKARVGCSNQRIVCTIGPYRYLDGRTSYEKRCFNLQMLFDKVWIIIKQWIWLAICYFVSKNTLLRVKVFLDCAVICIIIVWNCDSRLYNLICRWFLIKYGRLSSSSFFGA